MKLVSLCFAAAVGMLVVLFLDAIYLGVALPSLIEGGWLHIAAGLLFGIVALFVTAIYFGSVFKLVRKHINVAKERGSPD